MDDLLKNHRKISRLFSRVGGDSHGRGAIEQVLHYERNGSNVSMREELRQDIRPIMERNAIARTREQQAWNKGLGKEIACIPDLWVEIWKDVYGWDFDKANLKKPEDKAMFDWLMKQDEWKGMKTYDASVDTGRGHLVKGLGK